VGRHPTCPNLPSRVTASSQRSCPDFWTDLACPRSANATCSVVNRIPRPSVNDGIGRYFGLSERQARRRIEACQLPTFMLGGLICARLSTLSAWIAALELPPSIERSQ
jgi:hypothetical protein